MRITVMIEDDETQVDFEVANHDLPRPTRLALSGYVSTRAANERADYLIQVIADAWDTTAEDALAYLLSETTYDEHHVEHEFSGPSPDRAWAQRRVSA